MAEDAHYLRQPPASEPTGKGDDRLDRALDQIRVALASLRFGQVLITVQDGVVVQIDRTEKTRLR